MTIELTNREFLETIINLNDNYKLYFSFEYNKFLEEILPYSKKLGQVRCLNYVKKVKKLNL